MSYNNVFTQRSRLKIGSNNISCLYPEHGYLDTGGSILKISQSAAHYAAQLQATREYDTCSVVRYLAVSSLEDQEPRGNNELNGTRDQNYGEKFLREEFEHGNYPCVMIFHTNGTGQLMQRAHIGRTHRQWRTGPEHRRSRWLGSSCFSIPGSVPCC